MLLRAIAKSNPSAAAARGVWLLLAVLLSVQATQIASSAQSRPTGVAKAPSAACKIDQGKIVVTEEGWTDRGTLTLTLAQGVPSKTLLIHRFSPAEIALNGKTNLKATLNLKKEDWIVTELPGASAEGVDCSLTNEVSGSTLISNGKLAGGMAALAKIAGLPVDDPLQRVLKQLDAQRLKLDALSESLSKEKVDIGAETRPWYHPVWLTPTFLIALIAFLLALYGAIRATWPRSNPIADGSGIEQGGEGPPLKHYRAAIMQGVAQTTQPGLSKTQEQDILAIIQDKTSKLNQEVSATVWKNLNDELSRIKQQNSARENQRAMDEAKITGTLAGLLKPSKPQASRSGQSPQGPEFALAAIANRWLDGDKSDSRKLEELAADTSCSNAKLAMVQTKGDVEEGISGCVEHTRGAWLMLQVDGDREVLVVPVLAAELTMGAYPYQLSRMFEGATSQDLKGNFGFQAIYRACRLRRSGPDTYDILERGVLQLSGRSAPSGAPVPVYEDYRTNTWNSSALGKGVSMGSLFAGWCQSTSDALGTLSARMDALVALREHINSSIASMDSFREEYRRNLANLNTQMRDSLNSPNGNYASTIALEKLKQQVSDLETRILELMVDRPTPAPAIRRSTSAANVAPLSLSGVGLPSDKPVAHQRNLSPSTPASLSDAAQQIPIVRSDQSVASDANWPKVAAPAPAIEVPTASIAPAATTWSANREAAPAPPPAPSFLPQPEIVAEPAPPAPVVDSPRTESPSTFDRSAAERAPSPTIRQRVTPAAPAVERRLRPETDWKEAVERASQFLECSPETRDLPSDKVYFARVQSLCFELRKAYTNWRVELVHLKPGEEQQRTVTLHRCASSPDGALECSECDDRTAMRFAVVFGEREGRGLKLLFPAGMLRRDRCAAGFTMLIDGITREMQTIMVQPATPAQLELIAGSNSNYRVIQKLQSSAIGSGEWLHA